MPALPGVATQCAQALALLEQRGMTRLSEFHEAGVTATTIGRMERAGEGKLLRAFDPEQARLRRGIAATFERRGAPIPADVPERLARSSPTFDGS